MTANECIKGRRSIRKFTDQPVSHELLAQVVETASYAPSWKHTQIVRYIAVEGEKKAALAKCTAIFRQWENHGGCPHGHGCHHHQRAQRL